MKKLLVLSLAFLFFSCSQDESVTNERNTGNETTTIDNSIGYQSPYNFNRSGYLEQGNITYAFVNNTDISFQVTPYFGPAFYMQNIGPNNRHGQYTNAEEFTVAPHDNRTYTSIAAVPTNSIYPWGTNDFFDFPSGSGDLAKRGKLFYIEFTVNNQPISMGKVKIPFPYNVNSSTGLPSPWMPAGIPDTVFSDELVYNNQTKEVCSTIRSTGAVKDYTKFVYSGRNYNVKTAMNGNTIVFTLNPF